jgi:hypothetical protein
MSFIEGKDIINTLTPYLLLVLIKCCSVELDFSFKSFSIISEDFFGESFNRLFVESFDESMTRKVIGFGIEFKLSENLELTITSFRSEGM